MGKGIFVTGTGTDIGKTYVTALLVKKLRESGKNGGYFKAAVSGALPGKEGLIPADAVYVNEIAQIGATWTDMVPYIYPHEVSPHLAAQMVGNPMEWKVMEQAYQKACQTYDYVTMEGSGGIVCPLRGDDPTIMLTDVIRRFHLGVLLVAGSGLGTINNTVLTVDYAKHQGIEIKGVILNCFHRGDRMEEDNKKMIERLTGKPVIACVEEGATDCSLDAETLAGLYGDVETH